MVLPRRKATLTIRICILTDSNGHDSCTYRCFPWLGAGFAPLCDVDTGSISRNRHGVRFKEWAAVSYPSSLLPRQERPKRSRPSLSGGDAFTCGQSSLVPPHLSQRTTAPASPRCLVAASAMAARPPQPGLSPLRDVLLLAAPRGARGDLSWLWSPLAPSQLLLASSWPSGAPPPGSSVRASGFLFYSFRRGDLQKGVSLTLVKPPWRSATMNGQGSIVCGLLLCLCAERKVLSCQSGSSSFV